MKRTRIMIVAILLFALLLSSCGQIVPKAAQTALLATMDRIIIRKPKTK